MLPIFCQNHIGNTERKKRKTVCQICEGEEKEEATERKKKQSNFYSQ